MKIQVARLNIEIENRYPYLESICRDYLADFDRADLHITVSETEIADEIIRSTLPYPPTSGYAESICVFRAIAQQLPRFDAFVFHAAVVAYEGRGYAFSAPSGTGKTTHARLWMQVFGENGAEIINGDKPILRFIDGTLYAFGTPWCGKERMQKNTAVPLCALSFLERATENTVRTMGNAEAVARLIDQIIMPTERDTALVLLAVAVAALALYVHFEFGTVPTRGMR